MFRAGVHPARNSIIASRGYGSSYVFLTTARHYLAYLEILPILQCL